MSQGFAVAGHWKGEFDEAGLQRWAEELRAGLVAKPSLALVFMTPRYFPQAKQVLEIIRVHAQIPLLAGCSSQALTRSRKTSSAASRSLVKRSHARQPKNTSNGT